MGKGDFIERHDSSEIALILMGVFVIALTVLFLLL